MANHWSSSKEQLDSRTATSNQKKSVNVLSLDGGGVRGLSTLFIIRALLCLVNKKLGHTDRNDKPIHPREVFDLIVGTSTGGLIALMMVKFNMSVDLCIQKYRQLSQKIFKQWHVLGYASGGFGAVTKFSSRNLRNVLIENVIQPGLPDRGIRAEEYTMEQIDSHLNTMCSVVCNGLYEETKERDPDAEVFICSHWVKSDTGRPLVCNYECRKERNEDEVPVISAARATSAAPTYFTHVELLGSLLVDGGFGFTNNPSHVAYEHYFGTPSRLDDYHHIRIVNIGTGTKPKGWRPKKSLRHRLPYFRGALSVLKSLADIATDSERVAGTMRSIAGVSLQRDSGILSFARFSADCGEIHEINLYEHGALDRLERITEEYLRKEEVMRRLDEFAEELVETCRGRQGHIFSGISQTETGERLAPVQIILSEPVDREPQDNQVRSEQGQELAPGSPPDLTDISSRGSLEMPPTPIASPRSSRTDASDSWTKTLNRLLYRRRQKPGSSGEGPAMFP